MACWVFLLALLYIIGLIITILLIIYLVYKNFNIIFEIGKELVHFEYFFILIFFNINFIFLGL